MRDGHNGYAPSVGIAPAREAVAAECTRRGMPLDARSRRHHVGHVGRHRAGADGAGRGRATKCSSRRRPIRSTPRCSRRSARGRCSTGTTPTTAGCRTSGDIERLITPATRALVVIDPNNPTGATYPDARAARAARDRRRAQHPAARRRGLRRSRVRRPGRRDRAASIPTRRSSRSRRCRRRTSRRAGAPAGWPSAAPSGSTTCSARSRSWRTAACAAPAPMEYAIVAALNGDRSHQQAFRAALRERADADGARG